MLPPPCFITGWRKSLALRPDGARCFPAALRSGFLLAALPPSSVTPSVLKPDCRTLLWWLSSLPVCSILVVSGLCHVFPLYYNGFHSASRRIQSFGNVLMTTFFFPSSNFISKLHGQFLVPHHSGTDPIKDIYRSSIKLDTSWISNEFELKCECSRKWNTSPNWDC